MRCSRAPLTRSRGMRRAQPGQQPVAQRGDARRVVRHLRAARAGRPRRARPPAASAGCRERSPRSCPPPENSGASRTRGRRRTYSAPTPFGPYSLWPLSASRSMPMPPTSSGILPAACAASVWNSAPASCASGGEGGEVLDHAGLVVHRHDADQQRGRGAAPRAARPGRAARPAAPAAPPARTPRRPGRRRSPARIYARSRR